MTKQELHKEMLDLKRSLNYELSVGQLQQRGYIGKLVPLISEKYKLPTDNIDELLKIAEGSSLNHLIREGLVFKRIDGEFSFKIINNEFLVKEK
jgi:hypothetical protein